MTPRKRWASLTADERTVYRRSIGAAVRRGEVAETIARTLHLTEPAVQTVIEELLQPDVAAEIRAALPGKAIQLRESGASAAEISRTLGIAKRTLDRFFEEAEAVEPELDDSFVSSPQESRPVQRYEMGRSYVHEPEPPTPRMMAVRETQAIRIEQLARICQALPIERATVFLTRQASRGQLSSAEISQILTRIQELEPVLCDESESVRSA